LEADPELLEAAVKIPVTIKAEYIRIIVAELQRLNSHFMGVGALLNDCGCASCSIIDEGSGIS